MLRLRRMRLLFIKSTVRHWAILHVFINLHVDHAHFRRIRVVFRNVDWYFGKYFIIPPRNRSNLNRIFFLFQYALFWGSLFVAYLLIYSGVLALFPQMSVYLYSLSYFCFGRYAFDSMVLSVYGYGREPLYCPEEMTYCHLRFPEKIMMEMGVVDGRFWTDFFALVANLIIFRVIAYYALKRKVSIGQK